MDVKLIDFWGSAFCKYRLYNCKDAFPMFSARLHTGCVYNFISDFACGSWAAVSCIGGKGILEPCSKIMINDNFTSQKVLRSISGSIPEERKFPTNKSARKLIMNELEKSNNVHEKIDEIIEIFQLSENRIKRPISQCSGEIFPISLALQYVRGKKILCFPWISEYEMNRIEGCWKQILFLRQNDTMILIPSAASQNILCKSKSTQSNKGL